jgi:hypothetical protein
MLERKEREANAKNALPPPTIPEKSFRSSRSFKRISELYPIPSLI